MRIINVQINGITNPIGFTFKKVTCSWKVIESISQTQKEARIEVSTDKEFSDILYKKSGDELHQEGETLELGLKPRTTYYYRVQVTGDKGDTAISDVHIFETGKMEESWEAEWISTKKEDTYHPIMKKILHIKKEIKRARFYGTGVGLFEVYVNGIKLGNEHLMPYINDYETSIQVLTFPMEQYLRRDNTIEISLAKGWYMGVFGLDMKAENYGNRMAAIGEIYLEYADKSVERICTDNTWTYYGSDIEDSGIYDGEICNRLLWEGKENLEKYVDVLKEPETEAGTKNLNKRHLLDRISVPIIEKEEISVKEVIITPAGELVLDMGQNFAGYIEFTALLPKGTKVVFDFGEILQQGNFYNKNYRDAKSQFVYISKGKKEVVHPHFTFYGFRYVRVTGWVGPVNKKDFIGKVIYSDINRTGNIETANEKINRLYRNTIWGLKSNFIDIPTDCPQRSERLGWTGDAQVFAPTASYHMDTRAFFHKFLKDLRDEQKTLKGGVPNYVPNIGHKDDVGSVWGDIATFLPNTLYQFYGDLEEVENSYYLMKDWVEYINERDKERGSQYLYNFGFTFGDWLALDGASPTSFKGSTDDVYISTLYYCRSIQIVKEMAHRLNKKEDVSLYAQLEEKVKQAIFHEFFTPSGRLAIDTQAAYVIALKFGIYMNREKLIEQFKQRLQKDCNQIKCGFVGATMICTVLAEAGLYETAYDFLLREDYPGWLYSVNLGATTIWERWNSVLPDGTISDTGMNSLNHYAYGSVMEFVYAYAAGIRPLIPGYKKAIIAPHPDIRIPYINCSYDSVSGKYVCNWKIDKDGKMVIHIEVPFNCIAIVKLPGYETEQIELKSGSYDYTYMPKEDFRKAYSKETMLSRISKDKNAMEILNIYAPVIAGIAQSKEPEMGANTLNQIYQMEYLPFEPIKLKKAIKEISELIIS